MHLLFKELGEEAGIEINKLSEIREDILKGIY